MRVGNGSMKVPIKPHKGFNGQTFGVIDFRCVDSPHMGIRLNEIPSKANQGLIAHGNEHVLRGLKSIRLYLSWPGYSTTDTYFTIKFTQIWKARLAVEVSRQIETFFQKCYSVPVSSSSTQWRVGPGAIMLENVILMSIIDMGEGIWQADLEFAP